jgi:hypothetical protein
VLLPLLPHPQFAVSAAPAPVSAAAVLLLLISVPRLQLPGPEANGSTKGGKGHSTEVDGRYA